MILRSDTRVPLAWSTSVDARRAISSARAILLRQPSRPFDVHFDDDFWFYFRSREENARAALVDRMQAVGELL